MNISPLFVILALLGGFAIGTNWGWHQYEQQDFVPLAYMKGYNRGYENGRIDDQNVFGWLIEINCQRNYWPLYCSKVKK